MSHKSAPYAAVSTIGIDLGKDSFHLSALISAGRSSAASPSGKAWCRCARRCPIS